MEIKIVGEQVEEADLKQAGDPSVAYGPDFINKMAIGDVLGMERSELHKYEKSVNTLLDYVRTQTDDLSPENIKWTIRQLHTKTGTPPLGEHTITYLSRYAYLRMEKGKLEKELSKYDELNESS